MRMQVIANAIVSTVAVASLGRAQSMSAITQSLHQLEAGTPSQRVAAFYALDRDRRNWATPAASSVLLSVLQREDALSVGTLEESHGKIGVGDKFGEGYGEYQGQLTDRCFEYCDREAFLAYELHNIAQVPNLRFDTINQLAVEYKDSRFSPAQRARINAAFIAAVAEPSSNMVREAGIHAVGAALRSGLVSSDDSGRLHQAVVRATADPYLSVRLAAIRRLTELRDPADLPVLRRLAAEDTATAVRAGKTFYPAREAARIAIAGMRSP